MLDNLGMGTGDFECTVCRERINLAPFEQRLGAGGDLYELWLCLSCGVVLNATHLRTAQADSAQDEVQAETSDIFYSVDPHYLATVPDEIDANTFTDFLFAQCPDLSHRTALDFGAGRGITAAAAAKKFDRVYAAELSDTVLSAVYAVMPQKDKVCLTRDYQSIPEKLDAIYAMHTLEHLPKLRDFLDEFVEKLAPGGALFFQVPMMRRDYLVCVHYTFFNEISCRQMANQIGLELTGVWYDNDQDFLTCIMRKPKSPGESIVEVACGCGESGFYTIEEAEIGCKSCGRSVMSETLARVLRIQAVHGAVLPVTN